MHGTAIAADGRLYSILMPGWYLSNASFHQPPSGESPT